MNARERIEYHQDRADAADASEEGARYMAEKLLNSARVAFRENNYSEYAALKARSDEQNAAADKYARSSCAHRVLERAARIALAEENFAATMERYSNA